MVSTKIPKISLLFLLKIDSISSDELKSLLLNLNLHCNQMVLDDYKEAHFSALGADSSRSGESINWE
jgi:hypothetical protein